MADAGGDDDQVDDGGGGGGGDAALNTGGRVFLTSDGRLELQRLVANELQWLSRPAGASVAAADGPSLAEMANRLQAQSDQLQRRVERLEGVLQQAGGAGRVRTGLGLFGAPAAGAPGSAATPQQQQQQQQARAAGGAQAAAAGRGVPSAVLAWVVYDPQATLVSSVLESAAAEWQLDRGVEAKLQQRRITRAKLLERLSWWSERPAPLSFGKMVPNLPDMLRHTLVLFPDTDPNWRVNADYLLPRELRSGQVTDPPAQQSWQAALASVRDTGTAAVEVVKPGAAGTVRVSHLAMSLPVVPPTVTPLQVADRNRAAQRAVERRMTLDLWERNIRQALDAVFNEWLRPTMTPLAGQGRNEPYKLLVVPCFEQNNQLVQETWQRGHKSGWQPVFGPLMQRIAHDQHYGWTQEEALRIEQLAVLVRNALLDWYTNGIEHSENGRSPLFFDFQ